MVEPFRFHDNGVVRFLRQVPGIYKLLLLRDQLFLVPLVQYPYPSVHKPISGNAPRTI